jgi:hypothetical protein
VPPRADGARSLTRCSTDTRCGYRSPEARVAGVELSDAGVYVGALARALFLTVFNLALCNVGVIPNLVILRLSDRPHLSVIWWVAVLNLVAGSTMLGVEFLWSVSQEVVGAPNVDWLHRVIGNASWAILLLGLLFVMPVFLLGAGVRWVARRPQAR